MTTPRQALLKTANHIEENPGRYSFFQGHKPKSEKACGCVLSWTGFFLDQDSSPFYGYCNQVAARFNTDDDTFYTRMNRLASGWMYDAERAAQGIRRYVKKYLTKKAKRK